MRRACDYCIGGVKPLAACRPRHRQLHTKQAGPGRAGSQPSGNAPRKAVGTSKPLRRHALMSAIGFPEHGETIPPGRNGQNMEPVRGAGDGNPNRWLSCSHSRIGYRLTLSDAGLPLSKNGYLSPRAPRVPSSFVAVSGASHRPMPAPVRPGPGCAGQYPRRSLRVPWRSRPVCAAGVSPCARGRGSACTVEPGPSSRCRGCARAGAPNA